jgi:hypothetical protein
MGNIMEDAERALAVIEALPITELILLGELAVALREETRERRLRTLVEAARRRGDYLERQAAKMRARRGQ